MKVRKRDGTQERVSFDKILVRLEKLAHGLNSIEIEKIAKKVIDHVEDDVETQRLDEFAAETCAQLLCTDPQYGVLASRLVVSNCHKTTPATLLECVTTLYENRDRNGDPSPLVSKKYFDMVMLHHERLQQEIDFSRDFLFDYFGFMTLEKQKYLMRTSDKKLVERPQYMYMRIALCIHDDDLELALQTYHLMSRKHFTHATPTMYNAGKERQQLSSCFLIQMEDDSIEGIFNTVKETAKIRKHAGGIGINVHNVRCTGSLIRGTNGDSTGLVPMLRVLNETADYVDQGGSRKGSFAIYLEPWHGDVEAWLDMRKNSGNEKERARDLFYGLWIPDLFMQRVKDDAVWSLMCPDACRGLSDCHGEEFDALYTKYEAEGKYVKQVSAKKLFYQILRSQIETGNPYLCYKDAANRKNNQKNLGTLKSSNLCTEIMEFTSPEEIAVCNLLSICLPKCVFADDNGSPYFCHKTLHQVARIAAVNLDKVIDRNFYPVEKARLSNLRHRPVGIGVQGLADVFILMRLPFESREAAELNEDIFETIYHGALEASCETAKKRAMTVDRMLQARDKGDLETHDLIASQLNIQSHGKIDETYPGAYSTFGGSPASMGVLQFDMWGVTPRSGRYDWDSLKAEIVKWGLRNSLLTAVMPTASTSNIAGNNECIEPYTSNVYTRKVLAGYYTIINRHLIADLVSLGLWNKDMSDKIIAYRGSVQKIPEIPASLREIYKTAWEIKQRTLIDQSAARGAYVDQSQSLNLFVSDPTFNRLINMHMYAWEKGLKTGCYYLRVATAANAQQFTVDSKLATRVNEGHEEETGCTSCGA